MVARDRLVVGLLGLGLCCFCPVLAESPSAQPYRLAFGHGPIVAKLDISRPMQAGPVDRQATIAYVKREDPGERDHGVASITWYYASRPDGSDRRRVVTYFYDRFDSDFSDRWIPVNAVRTDWNVQREAAGRTIRRILHGRTDGEPLVSLDHFTDSFVVSAKLRPRAGARDFGVAARAKCDGPGCYALRGAAELINPMAAGPCAVKSVRDVDANRWYWYELGVKNRNRNGEVAVRARIWDGNHERVLQTLGFTDKVSQAACPQGQRIALLGGADYSEIYVDPWEARWLGQHGHFDWDTRNVPNGDYFLIADVDADPGSGPQRERRTDFKISVRH